MGCNRCIMVVPEAMGKLELEPVGIELREVEVKEELTPEKKQALKETIASLRFELLDDKKGRLVEKVKNSIIEIIHYEEDLDIALNSLNG